MNLQYIAGGLAIFFITLAIYKAISQKANKRAAAAKSLSQSKAGQEPTVSLHNPYPNGEPAPGTPPPSNQPSTPPSQPSVPAQTPQPQPEPAKNAPASIPNAAFVPPQPPASAAPQVPPPPEQIYKWN